MVIICCVWPSRIVDECHDVQHIQCYLLPIFIRTCYAVGLYVVGEANHKGFVTRSPHDPEGITEDAGEPCLEVGCKMVGETTRHRARQSTCNVRLLDAD